MATGTQWCPPDAVGAPSGAIIAGDPPNGPEDGDGRGARRTRCTHCWKSSERPRRWRRPPDQPACGCNHSAARGRASPPGRLRGEGGGGANRGHHGLVGATGDELGQAACGCNHSAARGRANPPRLYARYRRRSLRRKTALAPPGRQVPSEAQRRRTRIGRRVNPRPTEVATSSPGSKILRAGARRWRRASGGVRH